VVSHRRVDPVTLKLFLLSQLEENTFTLVIRELLSPDISVTDYLLSYSSLDPIISLYLANTVSGGPYVRIRVGA